VQIGPAPRTFGSVRRGQIMTIRKSIVAGTIAASLFLQGAQAQDETEVSTACDHGDSVTCLRLFKPKADLGNVYAQYDLSIVYMKGRGVPQDYAQALYFSRLAADQGFAPAQYNLGWLFDRGLGTLQDFKEAAKYYRLSADQGNADAQNNLGTLFAHGQGVPEDYVEAYMWFNLAAASGTVAAASNRDNIAASMTPGQIAEAQKLSREWKPK